MSHDAWVEEEKQDIPMVPMSAEEVWLLTVITHLQYSSVQLQPCSKPPTLSVQPISSAGCKHRQNTFPIIRQPNSRPMHLHTCSNFWLVVRHLFKATVRRRGTSLSSLV